MLRVAFMSQYPRGKMKDLVSLLQERDFETKDFKESIAEETFNNLSVGVLDFMNEYNFKQFILAIKDAGFISKKLITSGITLDFAYTLYLRLFVYSGLHVAVMVIILCLMKVQNLQTSLQQWAMFITFSQNNI